jgi:hypothetical protein
LSTKTGHALGPFFEVLDENETNRPEFVCFGWQCMCIILKITSPTKAARISGISFSFLSQPPLLQTCFRQALRHVQKVESLPS